MLCMQVPWGVRVALTRAEDTRPSRRVRLRYKALSRDDAGDTTGSGRAVAGPSLVEVSQQPRIQQQAKMELKRLTSTSNMSL